MWMCAFKLWCEHGSPFVCAGSHGLHYKAHAYYMPTRDLPFSFNTFLFLFIIFRGVGWLRECRLCGQSARERVIQSKCCITPWWRWLHKRRPRRSHNSRRRMSPLLLGGFEMPARMERNNVTLSIEIKQTLVSKSRQPEAMSSCCNCLVFGSERVNNQYMWFVIYDMSIHSTFLSFCLCIFNFSLEPMITMVIFFFLSNMFFYVHQSRQTPQSAYS